MGAQPHIHAEISEELAHEEERGKVEDLRNREPVDRIKFERNEIERSSDRQANRCRSKLAVSREHIHRRENRHDDKDRLQVPKLPIGVEIDAPYLANVGSIHRRLQEEME